MPKAKLDHRETAVSDWERSTAPHEEVPGAGLTPAGSGRTCRFGAA